jgi:sulfhydrogenase subunit beta (sulfur reductase)
MPNLFLLKQGRSIDGFLSAICAGREVFAHQSRGEHLHLVRGESWESQTHTLGAFRPVEPLKSLVFRPREALGSILENGKSTVPLKKRIAVGIKNCDLSALKIHDHVFLSDPVDPYYKEARERTALVSCDCTDACDVCFCPVVGEQPYAKHGFDINLAQANERWIIETGSELGEKLIEEAKGLLEDADRPTVEARDKNREAMLKKVTALAAKKGLRPGLDLRKAIAKAAESKLWDDFAKDCVECGACNFVCCTCHCFLLADGLAGAVKSRVKQWDSCLLLNFARVGGGANPRKHRAERLHNRFEKKFDFFPQMLSSYACDGCGRCAQACTGKIDIRDVLKRAVDEAESV